GDGPEGAPWRSASPRPGHTELMRLPPTIRMGLLPTERMRLLPTRRTRLLATQRMRALATQRTRLLGTKRTRLLGTECMRLRPTVRLRVLATPTVPLNAATLPIRPVSEKNAWRSPFGLRAAPLHVRVFSFFRRSGRRNSGILLRRGVAEIEG